MNRFILLSLLLVSVLFGASATTKVGGNGATKIGVGGTAKVQAAPFSPDSITWALRLEAKNIVLSNNTLVSTGDWPDTSGNSYSVSEVTGRKPTFLTNITPTGKPAVSFGIGGGDHLLQVTSFPFATSSTVFVYYAPTSVATGTLIKPYNIDTSWILQFPIGSVICNFNGSGATATFPTKNEIKCICYRIGGGTERFYENGVPMSGWNANKTGATGINIAALNTDGAYALRGNVAAVFIASSSLSDTQCDNMARWGVTEYGHVYGVQAGDPIRVMVVGDSISGAPSGTTFWPEQLTLGSGYTVTNLAVSGKSVDNITTDYPYQVSPFSSNRNVLVFFEVANQVSGVQGSDTGAVAEGKIAAYCTAARAAGYKVVVSNYWNNAAQAQACSNLIAANWTGYADAFVDINTATYRTYSAAVDNIHTNAAGETALAADFQAAILSLFP